MREMIKDYNRRVVEDQIRCDLEICPRCENKPDTFKRHDVRQRSVLVMVERLIIKVMTWMVRRKCSLCGKTFTDYPPFALPYKRFVSQEILERSLRYLRDDTMTYERSTRELVLGQANGRAPPRRPLPIFYDDPGKAGRLAPSTVHRWISTLGSLPKTLQTAMSLLLEKDADIHRQSLDVPPRKYRSQERRRGLLDALRLLHAEGRFRTVFRCSIFPKLAISRCWQ